MATGGLMDTNVPSQLDEDDLRAEIELELPDSGADPYLMAADMDPDAPEIEIIADDDGSVIVDFDPGDMRGDGDNFYANLAEEMPDRELSRIASDLIGEFDSNKSSRQEWEDTYKNGLELLLHNFRRRHLMSYCLPAARFGL